MRPSDAALRVVLVRDCDGLVGVAPFWAARGDRARAAHEPLAGSLSPPVGLLAASGREAEVAEMTLGALAEGGPVPSRVQVPERIGPGSPTERLVEAWPGPTWVHEAAPIPLPMVSLEGLDFEGWMAARRKKFRQEARRRRRRLEQEGVRFRLVARDEMDAAVDAFLRLHEARWERRGRSKVLRPGIGKMLKGAARELPEERLRIFLADAGGRPVAASVLVAAGPEVSGWSGGFDPAWGRHAPQLQLTLEAIADAAARGEERVCLGPGAEPAYKRQMTDDVEGLAVTTIVPRSARPGALAGHLGRRARRAVGERLPDGPKARIKRALGR